MTPVRQSRGWALAHRSLSPPATTREVRTMSTKTTTLYHPDGRRYSTGDPVEISHLKGLGYSEKAPAKKAPAPKPADEPKKS